MPKFAVFNDEGFPQAFYTPDLHGERMRPVYGPLPEPTEEEPNPVAPVIGEEPNPDCMIPADAIEITTQQWQAFIENQGLRRWQDGHVVPHEPPEPEPDPVVIRVAKADIWRRATDAEAEVIQALKAQFPLRLRMIFEDAQELRSTDEYWPTLFGAAEQAFGKARAEELLAASF